MKIFHLSDLHIGKHLNGYSLKENQESVLEQIIAAAKEYRPDAILICGDIYDKFTPSGEAFTIFDSFLAGISRIKPTIPVMLIAGNHDSPERLQYASTFLSQHHIHLSVMPPRSEEEYLKKIILQDEYGAVNFYLLPFLKPGYVRGFFKDGKVPGYEAAVRTILEREDIQDSQRNVVLSHQFYIAGSHSPDTCDSERPAIHVGGLDHVDIRVLSRFDYGALGHLHGPQKVGREEVRYCGSPYKYSVSEEHHKKGITMVTLKEKGIKPEVTVIPLRGNQDVPKLRGSLEAVLEQGRDERRHDFVSVTITDEVEAFHMREQLEEVYEYLLELRIDNSRTRKRMTESGQAAAMLSPYEAFCQFYETVRHCALTEEEEVFMKNLIEKAGEETGL